MVVEVLRGGYKREGEGRFGRLELEGGGWFYGGSLS